MVPHDRPEFAASVRYRYTFTHFRDIVLGANANGGIPSDGITAFGGQQSPAQNLAAFANMFDNLDVDDVVVNHLRCYRWSGLTFFLEGLHDFLFVHPSIQVGDPALKGGVETCPSI